MDLKDWLASRLTELGEELRRIDHDSSPQSRSVRHLYASGPGRFEGDVGKLLTDTCEVTVFYGDGTLPAEGTTVRFKVMDGPVRFSNGLTEITNTTDADGLAAVDLGFDQHGAGTVVADLEDGEGDAWFIGQSDQRTHDVHTVT